MELSLNVKDPAPPVDIPGGKISTQQKGNVIRGSFCDKVKIKRRKLRI